LEAVFILLEFPSPSRRIFIGSHSLPPLWFAVPVLHLVFRDRKLFDGLILHLLLLLVLFRPDLPRARCQN
jgi:hypothetical protein